MTSGKDGAGAGLPFRLVVLVGFMASGKTTVGRALARRLGWRFVDLDRRIEALAGATVPEIFSRWGEARFRELEVRAAGEALEEAGTVLATGGGWAAVQGRLEGLPGDVRSVWLGVTPEEALARARGDDGTARPLLQVEDPLARARELLEARRPGYAGADLHVDSGGLSPEEIVERILASIGI